MAPKEREEPLMLAIVAKIARLQYRIKQYRTGNAENGYLHEVDGVSTFKIPAVFLGLDTLQSRREKRESH